MRISMDQIVVVVKIESFYEFLKNKNKKWMQQKLNLQLTRQKATPRAVLPILSKGGDQSAKPITLGTTRIIPPLTPDFAGKPICNFFLMLFTVCFSCLPTVNYT